MRINLFAVGSRGDVQPAVALGIGLQKAGFDVQLSAFEEFRSLIEEHGLGFVPLGANVQELLNQYSGKKAFTGTALFGLLKLFQKMCSMMFTTLWQASRGCDLLISNTATSMFVEAVAEKLQVPDIETSVFPGWPTRAFPSFFGPWSPSLGARRIGLAGQMTGAINRFSYKPVNWIVSLLLRPNIERCRRDILGLPKKKPKRSDIKPAPILAGFSKHVLPRPSDWEENIHVTGYWYLDHPGYEPPPALQAFLDQGEPPVYIGFGSMPSEDPGQVTDLVIQALSMTKQRGILFTGQGILGRGMNQRSSANPVHFVESIPHDWLLPRVAAAIHHGGAGTTAAGIRAGVPSILVPVGADQRLWAYRVETLGVGPRPIPRAGLTAERLAKAITHAVTDHEICQRAVDLGGKIRAEDGVGAAVKLIREYLNDWPGGGM
ncbi:MAG: glycosyltransferase family 1 protein [Anaerolineae bacterium]|nr:glycosyltransferase family 1 protein [Anaerolineae bacterium]